MTIFFPWFLQNLIWPPTRIILSLMGNFKIYGAENLRGIKGAVIFASNHISELDPILLPAAFSWFSRFLPVFYVSREKQFYNIHRPLKRIFYGGIFFEMWGAYQAFVGLHNYEASLINHIKILEKGQSVMVFPEGRKSFDGKIHYEEARGGAAFLSHKTGAPIVPVVIAGAYKITPANFFIGRRHLSLTFGQPIYPKELFGNPGNINPHDYKTIVQNKIMPAIANLL